MAIVLKVDRDYLRNKNDISLMKIFDRLHAEIRKQQCSNSFGRDEVINTLVELSKDFRNICDYFGVLYGKC